LEKPRTPSKTIALSPKLLAVTTSAVNLLVWSIARQHAVQRSLADVAAEAFLVVGLSPAELLLSMEDFSTTSGAALGVVICLDESCIHKLGSCGCGLHTLRSISTQQSGPSLPKTIALQSKAFAVADITVNLLIRSITSNPGVEEPGAATALEALLVPHLALGEDLVSMIHIAATGWAPLALRRLQAFRVVFVLVILDRVLLAVVHLVPRVRIEGSSTATISVSLGAQLAPVASLAEESSFVLVAKSAV
jgi:hypothetical protein